MLKSINGILKTMGEALAFANTGEMLSEKQKSQVLIAQQKHCASASETTMDKETTASNEDFSIESIDNAVA